MLSQSAGARPRWKQARVQVVWCSATLMHPDPVNLNQYLKGAFDALQDAHIIENDRWLWPERPVIMTRQADPCVVLYVSQENEEGLNGTQNL